MGESVKERRGEADAAPFPSSAAIWEEIDLAERYLVCCMFEEALSLTSTIIRRLYDDGLMESVEDTELSDMTESAGMVFVQSLKESKRTSEVIAGLKELFRSISEVPSQVLITGACMQIAEGCSSTLRDTFEDFLRRWKYVAGYPFLFPNEDVKSSPSKGIRWTHLSLEKYLNIAEFYAMTILGTLVKDIDLAICWTEKAELPEEWRQEMLRRLHTFCSAKNTSSPVSTMTPQLADSTKELSLSGPTRKDVKDGNLQTQGISKPVGSTSPYRYLLNQFTSSFWWFRNAHVRCGSSSLLIHRGKIVVWGCLIIFILRLLQNRRTALQRTISRQVANLKRALIDAWRLAFSVQVNPLAAIQPLTSAPQGSR